MKKNMKLNVIHTSADGRVFPDRPGALTVRIAETPEIIEKLLRLSPAYVTMEQQRRRAERKKDAIREMDLQIAVLQDKKRELEN